MVTNPVLRDLLGRKIQNTKKLQRQPKTRQYARRTKLQKVWYITSREPSDATQMHNIYNNTVYPQCFQASLLAQSTTLRESLGQSNRNAPSKTSPPAFYGHPRSVTSAVILATREAIFFPITGGCSEGLGVL